MPIVLIIQIMAEIVTKDSLVSSTDTEEEISITQINLPGKTVVVAGGGQGLGAATCQILGRARANVVVNYFSDSSGINQKRAEEVVKQ